MNWKDIQRALVSFGYGVGRAGVDGIPGRDTMAALRRFKGDRGLGTTNTIGPQTLAALFPRDLSASSGDADPPWMTLLAHKMGLHEMRDRKALAAFLRSDGATLGDPALQPWCGDLVETVIALALPEERLPVNPYLARNWTKFGRKDPNPGGSYGAVAAFWRISKAGTAGHAGFPVGINQAGTRFRLRGGNQNNQIGDVWIDKGRLLALRVPVTWTEPLRKLPILKDDGRPASINEA